ncbi:hypothetical protein PACTADRAFT_34243 [Pachysolen tannophilus NRRL Y-2460]|uniref:Uncharacterized protein n=1 Tax=Pachysolen tannophilus NRRL Y-2460 TaxID=669874 RepID=A0A1E4TVC4_PACTA|nr:hypothetical protein PACTADRAFT_34243 [Pachysolen tannophilus NRRL Y-2460]
MPPSLSILTSSSKDNNGNGSIAFNSKEKKYIVNVEKSINNFDSVIEWADYISFLSKLVKSLQSNPNTENTKNFIPYADQLSKCLSNCLNKNLPSGVHKKTLEVYELVFNVLGLPQLAETVDIWLPGLLPLISFASMSVKPQIINLFGNFIVTLPSKTLRIILKPLLLSLLPSIDDETSETFIQCLSLIDSLKLNLNSDSHFWNVLFLCIITSPDRRLGGLIWCNKRLPHFNITSDETEKSKILELLPEDESKACIATETGLLVRAISKGLRDENLFVQRGFFDVLVTRLELKSDVLQKLINEHDKENLIMSALSTVLRKDMSLNRRLWNWLLGPDPEAAVSPHKSRSSIDDTHSVNSATSTKLTRSEYFSMYGLNPLIKGLLKLINASSNCFPPAQQRIESYKIALAMMDKWEISQLIIPKVLTPILKSCYNHSKNNEADEENVLKFANSFFDNVDCLNIWSNFLEILLQDGDDSGENFKLCLFILRNFNVEEEDMIVNHLPLILISLLCIPKKNDDWYTIIKVISSLIPQRAYSPIDAADKNFVKSLKNPLQIIKNYYLEDETDANDESESNEDIKPFKSTDIGLIMVSLCSQLIAESISDIVKFKQTSNKMIYPLTDVLCDILDKIPQLDKQNELWRDDNLLEVFGNLNQKSEVTCIELAFSFGKIFDHLVKPLSSNESIFQKLKLLKNLLSLLWKLLLDFDLSNKYQIELIRIISNLEMSVDTSYIESCLSSFFIEVQSVQERLRIFNLLYTHTLPLTVALTPLNGNNESILSKWLQLILDGLNDENEKYFISNWVLNLLNSGMNANKLFKILISPILEMEFLCSSTLNVDKNDLCKFNYNLNNLINFIDIDRATICENLTNEVIVADSDLLIKIMKANNWKDTSYKIFMINILLKFINFQNSDSNDKEFQSSFKSSLSLITFLVDGNESNLPHIFENLINLATKHIRNNDLILISLIDTLNNIIQNDKKNKLAIFFKTDEDTNRNNSFLNLLIDLITFGSNSILLNYSMKLLTNSLKKFNDSIFNIALILTECITTKVLKIFNNFVTILTSQGEVKSKESVDVDQSISIMLNSLVQLTSFINNYLKTHELNFFNSDSNGLSNGYDSTEGAGESFFGTVIQGVFQVETPVDRNLEQNKKIDIILSFRNCIKCCYDIWLWSETNSKIINTDDYDHSKIDNNKSLLYNSTKFKYKSKKFLEFFHSVEPLNFIENLIEISVEREHNALNFKILHILDGSRPQLTLPHIVKLINNSKTNSSDTSISNLNGFNLVEFLFEYLNSLSDDLIEDLITIILNFLKDINSKIIVPSLLKVIVLVNFKLNQIESKLNNGNDFRKFKKELSDYYIKFLNTILSDKDIKQDDFVESLIYSVPKISILITDQDKLMTSFLNNVINNFLINYFKNNKKFNEMLNENQPLLDLLIVINNDQISDSCKSWRLMFNELLFNNNSFFSNIKIKQNMKIYNSIYRKLYKRDNTEKLQDLILKISTSSASSALINWNDYSEILNFKRNNLKKLNYLILVNDKNGYINLINPILTKVKEIFNKENNDDSEDLKIELYLLLRILLLRLSSNHLSHIISVVYFELQKFFKKLLNSLINGESTNSKLIVQACKLLDVALILKIEDFQLDEWLFINDNEDCVYFKKDDPSEELIGLIEKISRLDLKEDSSEKISDTLNHHIDLDDDDDKLLRSKVKDLKRNMISDNLNLKIKPLLTGVKDYQKFNNLRSCFYNYASIYNFENNYNNLNYVVDFEILEKDCFDDLFDV